MPQPRNPNKPISQELADKLAYRIVLKVERVRRGRLVCWESVTCVNPVTGYAHVAATVDGKLSYYLRHRVMYVHYYGPFPPELTIDHMCENPACCNPKHLRLATHAANVLRSTKNPFALHAQQSHCKNGHPLPARTLTESTSRKCAECRRIRAVAQYAKRSRSLKQLPPDDPRHGTGAGYDYWRCRCTDCKAWQRSNYLTRKAAS